MISSDSRIQNQRLKPISRFVARHSRAMLISTIIIALMIIAVLVVLRFVHSPESKEQGIRLTTERVDRLTDSLTDQQFHCYDSELQSGKVRRCFAGTDRYKDAAIASVTIVKDTSNNELISVSATVDGSDADDARKRIANAFDDAFDRSGDNIINRHFTRPGNTGVIMAGKNILLADDGTQMRIMNAQLGPASILPKPVPFPYEYVSGLEDHGFTCSSGTTIVCTQQLAGLEVSVQSSPANVNAPQHVKVWMKPENSKRNAKKARARLGRILSDSSVRLTDKSGAKFLADAPGTGERADFGDYGLEVLEGASNSAFAFTISALTPENQGNAFGW